MIALLLLAATPTGVALGMCALERLLTRNDPVEGVSDAQNRPSETRTASRWA